MSETTDTEPASLQGMVTTFITGGAVSLALVGVFLILRSRSKRFYAPRTYLGSIPESERTPALPRGIFNWVGAFWKIPDSQALKSQTLDSYLFLRFLRICTAICFVGLCMTWPTLFPINATGGNGQKQLDILSFSNINTKIVANRNRLFGHVLVGGIFYAFVLYMILRECIFYINLRQAFLLAPQNARRISSRTVLFTSVPEKYLDEARIRNMFKDTAKRVWVTGDTSKLDDLVKERTKVAMKLEGAEVKLLKIANANRVKGAAAAAADDGQQDKALSPQDTETGDLSARWVPQKKRPTHRTGPLGLWGEKVDTIEWSRVELERLSTEIAEGQTKYKSGDKKLIPAVFVEFYNQSDAQAALQTVTHHHVFKMTPKYIGVRPEEVVWSSLKVSWWQKIVRRYIVIAFITAMIVFWAIPVAFVASIAQVQELRQRWTWLSFLDVVPPVIMGVITGLLPSVLLAILMSLVPVVMRLCAKLAGEPSLSRIELFTQAAYFVFQVVQVFLVTTISGAVFNTIGAIAKDPTKAFELLSTSLPKASNFYISFFIIQGITIAASVLTQVAGFAIFHLTYKFLARTPRAMFQKWTTLAAVSWGSVMPVYTNIAVISITYAVIAPLMLFWSTIGMALFYLAYRYNVLFITENAVDTGGLIYPRALKQLLTGVYLAQVCMVGLCAISQAFWPLIIMIIILVLTILFQLTIQSALDPLLYNLPRSLQVEEEGLMHDAAAALGSDDAVDGESRAIEQESSSKVAAKGNVFTKFFKPWKFASYRDLRKLVPHHEFDLDHLYEEETEANSYHPPSVSDQAPLLWIPEDVAGISKQEVLATGRVNPITDAGCSLDDKNNIVWDSEGARPPIWEEKTPY
ncbi:related to A.thaliana hyp1 protein [Cephalotrichum gorgonifer]|uniref:Related to A.thaliana hyp1 protein n=1 Tax=Cephalotrichum gorgonifer TaxID=2041049 RepID=A0AAE8N6L7_9PEZI|nr:related to A.thaliana hyp1 protein [Cephalotrichum gorgonifer]